MLFLAMTAGEMERCPELPPHTAWMACHFSARNQGLSNIPRSLPEGSVITVNDQNPISGHDPKAVERQLRSMIEAFSPAAVLLDFQRPGGQEMVKHLVSTLPCPTGVSELYAGDLSCPVFLAPTPLCRPLTQIAAPWKGRELWLDAPVCTQRVTVTADGAEISPFLPYAPPQTGHFHEGLCVHYQVQPGKDRAVFTLFRGPDELRKWANAGENMGINHFFCLFQEFPEESS